MCRAAPLVRPIDEPLAPSSRSKLALFFRSVPFGGSLPTIVVNLDPEALRRYGLSPDKVAEALAKGNTVTPSGDARIGDKMPIVSINSLVLDPQDLKKIPIKPEQSIYLRDLGTVEDSSDIPFGWALVNGRRSIYMPINKTADASTLAVVADLRKNMDYMQSVLPDDVQLTLEFDQSRMSPTPSAALPRNPPWERS